LSLRPNIKPPVLHHVVDRTSETERLTNLPPDLDVVPGAVKGLTNNVQLALQRLRPLIQPILSDGSLKPAIVERPVEDPYELIAAILRPSYQPIDSRPAIPTIAIFAKLSKTRRGYRQHETHRN
jgi:hypothetical protein